jgi:O-antigen ligase
MAALGVVMEQKNVAPAVAVPLHAKITLLLLAAMSSLPFLIPHHFNPITSFANEWAAVALGLMAALPLLLAPRSWKPLRFPLIALVPLALALLAAVQIAAGKYVYWQHHMLVGLYLVWAALMMVMGSALRQQIGLERIAPVLAWALVGAGLASAIVVGLQIAGVESQWLMPVRGKKFSANLGQVNHLAHLLGLALASLVYLGHARRLPLWGASLIAVVLLAALALTGSRSAWLYLGMLLVVGILAMRRQPNGQGKSFLRMSIALLVVFAVLQYVLPLLLAGNVPAMAAERVIAAASDKSSRLQLLEVAWRTFLTSPWLGVGYGQFAWNDFLLAETVQHGVGRVTNAHNLFAHLLAEAGVAGALVALAGLTLWVFHVHRPDWTDERLWIIAMLGIAFIHSMLEYPLWYAYFLGLVAFLLGAGDEKSAELRFSPGPVVGLALAGFGAFCLFNIGQHYLQVERWYHMGRKQLALEAMERLPDLRRSGLMAPYLDHVLVRIMPDTEQFIRDKLVLNTQVIRFIPDGRDVYQQAALLARNGRIEEAKAQLRLALVRHPKGANQFAIRMLRINTPEVLPLLEMALAFDLKRHPVPGFTPPPFPGGNRAEGNIKEKFPN